MKKMIHTIEYRYYLTSKDYKQIALLGRWDREKKLYYLPLTEEEKKYGFNEMYLQKKNGKSLLFLVVNPQRTISGIHSIDLFVPTQENLHRYFSKAELMLLMNSFNGVNVNPTISKWQIDRIDYAFNISTNHKTQYMSCDLHRSPHLPS